MSPRDDSRDTKTPRERPTEDRRERPLQGSRTPPDARGRPTGTVEKISDDTAVDRTMTPPPPESDGD